MIGPEGSSTCRTTFRREVDHLARVLKQNGYLANFIRNGSAPPTGNSRHKQPKTKDRRRRRDHWW